MTCNAPGKHRNGMSLKSLFKMFPDDATSERWFVKARWPNGVACHYCGSVNVQTGAKHKTMSYRCRDCRKRFSARTGTARRVESRVSDVDDCHLSVSHRHQGHIQLHRDLGIRNQRGSWRTAFVKRTRRRVRWPGADRRAFVGGKEKNKHAKRKLHAGRGPVGKVAVAVSRIAQRSRSERPWPKTPTPTPSRDLADSTMPSAMADGEAGYVGLPRHEAVKHTLGEYVRGQAPRIGIESFWSSSAATMGRTTR